MRDLAALLRRALARLVPLGLVVPALLVAIGCGDSPGSLAEPIARQRVAADLLALAEVPAPFDAATDPELSKWQGPRLDARAVIPRHGILHLDIRASRQDLAGRRPIGPSRFRLEIDGVQVFRKTLFSWRKHTTFAVDLKIDDLVRAADLEPGREALFSFSLENSAPQRTKAYWHQARLHEVLPTPRRRAADGRNLLVVVVDTLRADHLGTYGYPRPTSPAFDAFAAESLLFEQAVSQASWTLPAVASIFTGLYPPQHGLVVGGALSTSLQTFPETLQAAGFTTGFFSASPLISPVNAFDQGFETVVHRPWARAEEINQAFDEWLENKRNVQWMAYLHYIDPHDPYAAPGKERDVFLDGTALEDFDSVFEPSWIERWDEDPLNAYYFTRNFDLPTPFEPTPKDFDFLRARYDAEILSWDRRFGELLDTLRRERLLDRTVVLVTSDHGEEMAEHGLVKHGSRLYEESVHVPLALRAPGLVVAGRRADPVETRAIPRTLLHLVGLLDEPLRPGDLLASARPVFSHVAVPLDPADPWRRRPLATLRRGTYKLILDPQNGHRELYDLAVDPDELHDLAPRRPARADRFEAELRAWLADTSTADALTSPPLDAVAADELRALGYIQ